MDRPNVDPPWAKDFKPGEPCGLHPGCLSHVTKPCEGCGRIAGRYPNERPINTREEE